MLSNPPDALVALIAWEASDGQVTEVHVWDKPGAIADFFMEHVLPRKIDRLVIPSRSHICTEGAWPLLKWLCEQHAVDIVCVDEPPQLPDQVAVA